MKALIYTSILALVLTTSSFLRAQEKPAEYLGLPGDNLNLFAVMNLFRESETLEAFERDLNDSEKMVNNLDLNGDGYVDYLMVFDFNEGNIHNIVLRVALNQNENQDVAVFIVEKFSDGSVRVQLIGDEALYGENYIIEPNYAETPNPGFKGKAVQHSSAQVVTTTYYEIAYWPVVEYIYEPTYVVWVSPWFWGCYHPVWRPWRAHYWHFYYGYHYHWYGHYYAYYRPWRYHRCGCYHGGYYAHHRVYSPTVVVNITNNYYSNTYSKPERVRDGQDLFAQRHPDGIKKPERERPQRTAVEEPAAHTKPMEANRTARTSDGERESYNIISTRPLKEDRQDVKTPNDRNATDMNRVSREKQPQREAQPSKPVSSKPQATDSRENATAQPIRDKTPEPARTSNSGTRESKPSVSRSDNSGSSSSGSSSSSGWGSKQSSGSSSSSSGSSSVGSSSRQSSSSGSSSGSGSSSSSSRQSGSSVSSGSSSSGNSSSGSSSSSSSKSDDSKSSTSSPKRR